MAKNLWGNLDDIEPQRTPTTVLKEQASELTEATKGVLRGSVESGMRYGRFAASLAVVAPALNDYEFTVAEVSHNLDLYPARLVADWDKGQREAGVECGSEAELEEALAQILTSERVRKAITSLIAQSKS